MRLILTSIGERAGGRASLGTGKHWIAAFAALSMVSGATAFGHGGAYRGPGGEVQGGSREPSDPPPPPEGDPPGTPSGDNPGGPNTGDGGTGGPKTGDGGGGTPNTGDGGPPTNPPGNGPGGPVTKGGRAGGGKGVSLAEWTFWWNYNKDALIGSRRRNAKLSAGTGTFLHGIGGRASGTGVISASEAEVANTLVPALLELLNASPKTLNSDIQSAAELALAKIGTPDLAAKLIEIAENSGGAYDRITVESAALALGILQRESPEVLAALTSLVADRKRDGSFVRPFAALSLGLLGSNTNRSGARGATSAALHDVIAGRESSQDIKPAAILALGLMGETRDVAPLLAMARTAKTEGGKEKLNDSEVAHAISALGRIGAAGLPGAGEETAVVTYLEELLIDRRERTRATVNSVRSAAIALGQIGAKSSDVKLQRRILLTLKQVALDDGDQQARHFALIAMGRVGAARGLDGTVRKEIVEFLRHELNDGRQLAPTFAAMSIAVIGNSLREQGIATDDEAFRRPLREKFADTKEARSRGAYAVALGLSGDALAVEPLRAVLNDKKSDVKVRGYAALGLALIGPADRSVRDDIRSVLVNEDSRELRVQTAAAAGLLGDGATTKELVAILSDPNQSQYVLGSVALALGQIGDARAIEPLVAIAKDGKAYPDLTRALATVALGQIGDRSETPVLARISTDINYRDQPSYEVEVLTIL